jgi:hypothetical protein
MKYVEPLWIIIFLIFLPVAHSQATTQNISFQDLDGDGSPDLAVIETSFYSKSDKILVFDKGNDMRKSQDWKECCDFINDVWVFDVAGDGKAELIIDFDKNDGQVTARIYDDINEDGKVAFRYNSTGFTVNESRFPTLIVKSEDGYWMKDGKINFNLKILGDGKVDIGQVYYSRIFKPNDGITDFRIQVYDDDRNGVPDYELRENLHPLKSSQRSMLLVNHDGKEAAWKDYIFWPYLGKGPGWWERGHNSASPPILVDWRKARISTVQLMVSDRYDDGNCFILTPDKILRHKTNILSFENPFCFYDLASDDDGYQEAVLRVVNRPDNRSTVNIRYSWDQDNNGKYDFSIKASGEPQYKLGDRHVAIKNFTDFSVVTIPFKDGPYWAFGRKWDTITFTDTNGLYWLGEGVYGHVFSAPVNYTVGNTMVAATRYVTGRNYHRAEFSRRKNQDVALYFSPIDGKLHLKNADKGTFTLRAKETGKWYGSIFSLKDIKARNFTVYENIDYDNLNGDAYINKWTYYVNNTLVKSLIYSGDVLIYYDRLKIKLLKTSIKPYLFETVPPRNYEEWEALGENLKKYKKEFDPRDFEAMFNQFKGEPITIEGGFIKKFNLTDTGFKAHLECVPLCVVSPSSAIEHKGPLGTGRYILKYNGSFKIIKSMLPDLEIRKIDVSLSNETPRESGYVTISARIHNKGNEDIGPVMVGFYEGEPGNGTLIGNRTIPVILAGKDKNITQRWLAKLGVKAIYVNVDPGNSILEVNEENNVALKQISVIPLKMLPASERVGIGSETAALKVAFAILLGMLFLAIYIGTSVLKD